MTHSLRDAQIFMPPSKHHAVMLSMVNSSPYSAFLCFFLLYYFFIIRAVQFGAYVTSESDDYLVDSMCYSVIFLHVSSGPLLFILGVLTSLEIKVEEYKQ